MERAVFWQSHRPELDHNQVQISAIVLWKVLRNVLRWYSLVPGGFSSIWSTRPHTRGMIFGPEKCLKEFVLTWWTCYENAILVHIFITNLDQNHRFERLKSGPKSHFHAWSSISVHFSIVRICDFGPDSKRKSGPKSHFRTVTWEWTPPNTFPDQKINPATLENFYSVICVDLIVHFNRSRFCHHEFYETMKRWYAYPRVKLYFSTRWLHWICKLRCINGSDRFGWIDLE